MLAFIDKHFSITMLIMLVIVIVSPIIYFETRPESTAVIILGRHHDYNYIFIRSSNGELERDLQMGKTKGSQSYLKTDNYLYSYGETGFVYIDLHTADVFIVLRDDINDELNPDYEEYLRSYYPVDYTKVDVTAPRIHIIEEDELDPEKRHIMEALKVVKIPFPSNKRIHIYGEK